MNRSVLILAVAALLMVPAAQAQVRVRPWYWGPGVHWGAGYPRVWPPYTSWGFPGAVSGAGDAMRGRAEIIRGQGEYNRATTEAMINYEEARRRYIDNQQKWVETRLEMQQMGREAREQHYAERRAARQPYLEANRAAAAARRASPTQVDPSTGAVAWPQALQADEFADDRAQMEELLSLRAYTTTTNDLAQQIYNLARQMQNKLRAKIRDLPANDYLEARKFLDQLMTEGQLAVR